MSLMKAEMFSSMTMLQLAVVALVPILKVKHAPLTAGKWIGWVWFVFATVPLQYEVVFLLLEGGGCTSLIVFGIIALIVATPAFFMARHPDKGSLLLSALAWAGVSVFGITFLFFAIGTPVLFFKAVFGRVPFDVVVGGGIVAIWSGSAVFICGVTVKVLKALKAVAELERRSIISSASQRSNGKRSRKKSTTRQTSSSL